MAIHNYGMRYPYEISLYPGSGTVDGVRGDHVLIAPPYNTSPQQLMEIVNKTVDVIVDYFQQYHTPQLPSSDVDPGRTTAELQSVRPLADLLMEPYPRVNGEKMSGTDTMVSPSVTQALKQEAASTMTPPENEPDIPPENYLGN